MQAGVLVTTTVSVSEALRVPLVPVTVKSAPPRVASEAAVSVSTEVQAGVEPEVAGLGEKSPVTPVGRSETASATFDVNPSSGVTVTV